MDLDFNQVPLTCSPIQLSDLNEAWTLQNARHVRVRHARFPHVCWEEKEKLFLKNPLVLDFFCFIFKDFNNFYLI